MPIGTVNRFFLPLIPYQRFQFSFVNQRVFGDEKIEMLVTSVDVSFRADGHQFVKVVNVNVNENAEETRQDLLTGRREIVGKRNVHSHCNQSTWLKRKTCLLFFALGGGWDLCYGVVRGGIRLKGMQGIGVYTGTSHLHFWIMCWLKKCRMAVLCYQISRH